MKVFQLQVPYSSKVKQDNNERTTQAVQIVRQGVSEVPVHGITVEYMRLIALFTRESQRSVTDEMKLELTQQ